MSCFEHFRALIFDNFSVGVLLVQADLSRLRSWEMRKAGVVTQSGPLVPIGH